MFVHALRRFGVQFETFVRSISGPEWFTIFALTIFGGIAALMTPVSAGYDEETHLARVWEMSTLQLIPNEELGSELPFPAVYYELSYRRLKLITAVPPEFLGDYAGLKLDAHDYIYGEFETRSVYAPPLLAPQAIVMRYLGRALGLPALTVFYVCRAVGLLSYILLAWLAVRWLPFGKWLMAVLAALPMAVFQASTISTDAISNGIALLFISATLAIASHERLGWRQWGWLALLFVILFWGKVNLAPLALLPFLVIRPSKFETRSQYILLILSAAVLFAVEVVGWNTIAYARYPSALEGASPAGQIEHILRHPFEFLGVLLRMAWLYTPGHARGWLALYGYDYWPPPGLVYVAYPAAIVAALFVRHDAETRPLRSTRLSLALVFLLTYVATVSSLYLSYTPVGSPDVQGIQGRYFFPVFVLLLLAIMGLIELEGASHWKYLVATPALLGLLLYAAGLILVYRVDCGAQYYRLDLCFQPNYKNFAPELRYSEPVSQNLTLTQEIVPRCNGMTALRIWLAADEAEPAGLTTFTVIDQNDSREALRIEVPNTQLPVDGWYTLTFEPDRQSAGKLYTLEIGSPGQDGPRISYSLRPEYTDGKLYENDSNVAEDVIFQYGCATGLRTWTIQGAP